MYLHDISVSWFVHVDANNDNSQWFVYSPLSLQIYITCMMNYSGNVKTEMSFTLNISTENKPIFPKYYTIQNPSTIEQHIYFYTLNGEEFQRRRVWDLWNKEMTDKCCIKKKGGTWGAGRGNKARVGLLWCGTWEEGWEEVWRGCHAIDSEEDGVGFEK